MKSSLVDEADGRRTYVIVLETGDEVMRPLVEFAIHHDLRGSQDPATRRAA